MYVSAQRCELDLFRSPVLHHAGINTHGLQGVETYHGLGVWCVHLYRYRAELRVNDQWFEIHPGRASILPPDAELEYRFEGASTHACAHFTPAPPLAETTIASLPLMQDLGHAFGELNRQLERVVAHHRASPARASAHLCDLLWSLSDAVSHGTASHAAVPGALHPAVHRALELIELRLAEPLYVADLAREVDVSHNHLTRLFRAATGVTIARHIARRRVDRAKDLLQHTQLPVKAVAAHVGITDLQQFNKLLRRTLGVSPTALRARGSAAVEAGP